MEPGRMTPCLLMFGVIAAVMTLQASEPPTRISEELRSVQRFLSTDSEPLREYRAFRRLEASNAKFNKAAWLEAWTEVDAAGFRYDIVSEGGSAYIANRVLRAALEREKTLWNRSLSARANLTTANYDFVRAGLDASGLMKVTVKPKREDELLINGVIILAPDTGDVLRVEGHLAKSPSFWISRIEVVCNVRSHRRCACPDSHGIGCTSQNGRHVELRDELRVRSDQWPTRRISVSCGPHYTLARNSI